jgi:hypothetical protein
MVDDETMVGAPVSGGDASLETGGTTESATIDGGRLESIAAQSVVVNQGNIGHVQAFDVSVNDGGIARAEATEIKVVDGGIGVAQGTSIALTDGAASVLVAESAHVQDSSVFLLVARHVSGNARVLLDVRAGAALGLVFGLTVVGLRLLLDRRSD